MFYLSVTRSISNRLKTHIHTHTFSRISVLLILKTLISSNSIARLGNNFNMMWILCFLIYHVTRRNNKWMQKNPTSSCTELIRIQSAGAHLHRLQNFITMYSSLSHIMYTHSSLLWNYTSHFRYPSLYSYLHILCL